jgi:hypothetical protein
MGITYDATLCIMQSAKKGQDTLPGLSLCHTRDALTEPKASD